MIKKSAVKRALKQRAQEIGILIFMFTVFLLPSVIEKYM